MNCLLPATGRKYFFRQWSMNKTIRVLVVDDSVLARTMITQGLAKSPRIEIVGTAFNAVDALAKVAQVKPDVITSDIEMPGMNGMEFLKKLLPKYPLPVILVSSLNLRVFDALSAGAVDFVHPHLIVRRSQQSQPPVDLVAVLGLPHLHLAFADAEGRGVYHRAG